MRCRLWLPVIQTLVMLLVLWSPWEPQAHQLDVLLVDGTEVRAWTLIPGPDALVLAQAINFPAPIVVIPFDLALRNGRGAQIERVIFFGLWAVGSMCWYMVGRFVDDFRRWRATGEFPPRHFVDLLFGLIAVPSAIFLTLVHTIDGIGPLLLMAAGSVWVIVTYGALWFRFKQYLRKTRTAD